MTIVRRLSVVGVPIALCLAGSSLVAQQVTSDRLTSASHEPQQLAHLFRHVRRPTVLAARSDHAHERRAPGAPVGVPDPRSRLARDDAARHRRRDVPHDAPEPRLRDRRPHRPAAVALRAHAAQGDVPLLRPAEPRDSARSAISCSWARSTPMSWRSMRRPAASAGTSRPPSQQGLQLHGRAARRQGQGHRRRRRRRIRRSAASSTPTTPTPGSARGASTRSRRGRAGQRHLGRRFVEARRRADVGHRRVRPGAEH